MKVESAVLGLKSRMESSEMFVAHERCSHPQAEIAMAFDSDQLTRS